MTQQHPGAPVPVLPDAVRRKIAGFALATIRGLKPHQVPPVLRTAMRWRSGAMPRGFADRVLEQLAADPAFRELVASQVGESDQLAQDVITGSADPASDPAAVAAVLYLARPDNWSQQLEAAVAALVAPGDPSEELQRARSQIEELRAKLARAQQRYDCDLAAARQGEADDKARLADSVARLREQLVTARGQLARATAENEDLQRQIGELHRDVRRLNAQVGQIKSDAGQQRAQQREAKLAATARAKVLLDVLQAAAAGLVAELALPAGTPMPADLVEADAPADHGASKRLHTAAELAQLLAAPRSHLIVDGYNVSKGMWPMSALAQQRERLIAALTSLHSRTGAEITVVFDGADVGGVPAATSRAVRVRFSPAGEPADRLIVRLVDADATGRPLVVASSDAALTSGARNAGARTVASDVLRGVLGAGR